MNAFLWIIAALCAISVASGLERLYKNEFRIAPAVVVLNLVCNITLLLAATVMLVRQ